MNPTPIDFTISPFFVWTMFSIILTFWMIITMVLTYHWKKFGVEPVKMALMKYLFIVGSVFIVMVLFLSALTYSIS